MPEISFENILIKENELCNVEKLTNIILTPLKYETITKADELLLNLIFSSSTTQEDLDKFLEEWDIEVFGGHKALMLAYFMKMHPELKYSDYVKPRLNGLIQFYRFHNMKLIAHYKKITNELKKHNIKFLIFKGGCMKHLRPEFPRIMGDIDILVQEKDFIKAGKIAKEIGYDTNRCTHSIDIHEKNNNEGIMDIHRYIPIKSLKEKAFIPDLFKRATIQNVFGTEALVPCNEDLLFISLANMIRNIQDDTSSSGIPYTLFDCKYLIDSKPDFNWDIISKNAKKTKTENNIYFAIQFINEIVPNLLPPIKSNKSFKQKFKDYCILLQYQRLYLWKMKQKSHEMKIKDLFTSIEFFIEYLKLKPKYFILKMGFIKKNPALAKIILKKAGLPV